MVLARERRRGHRLLRGLAARPRRCRPTQEREMMMLQGFMGKEKWAMRKGAGRLAQRKRGEEIPFYFYLKCFSNAFSNPFETI